MNTIREWIQDAIISAAVRYFTAENLKKVLTTIVVKLKAKAAATEGFVDDWIIEFVESIVNNEAKIALLYEHLKTILDSSKNGLIVEGMPDHLGINSLADALLVVGTERELQAFPYAKVIELLSTLLPLILNWFSIEESADDDE